MRCFTDATGRVWEVVVHVTAIKRVRGTLGLDLYSLVDDGCAGLGQLLADPVRLVDVIYVLCQDRARELGVSDEDFGRAMAGDAIEAASEAFLEEFANFFPTQQARESLARFLAMGKELREKLLARVAERLREVDLELEAEKLTASFGGSRESSGSTPTP